MYTTNAVESVNASFRKVVRWGCFPDEDAVLKLLCDEGIRGRIEKYL